MEIELLVLPDCPHRKAAEDLPRTARQRCGSGSWAPSTLAGPFRTILRDLGLTPNQVWRLTKTDGKWAGALEAALTATSRDDLKHGTTAAYVRGCVCRSVERVSVGEWPRPGVTRSQSKSIETPAVPPSCW